MITLNRPEKRNAISAEMIAELLSAFDEVEASPARVLILTGAGKAFCSGMDLEALKALATQSPAEQREDADRIARLCLRIWSFPKPTIAAVNGHAIAGGCGLATLCDFTIAVPEAKFGYPEVRIGFLPAVVSVFLVRQIGEKQRAGPAAHRKDHRRRRSASPGARHANRPGEGIDDRGANPGGEFARVQPGQPAHDQKAALRFCRAGNRPRTRTGRGGERANPFHAGFPRGTRIVPRKARASLERQMNAVSASERVRAALLLQFPSR